MIHAQRREHRLAWLISLALVAVLGVRSLFLGLGPEARLLGFVPDDAFYYFGIARGFARLREWTFDGGFSPASGFHLLHAYFNAAILHHLTTADWRCIVGTNLGMAWLVISVGFGLMAAALYRRFGLWGVIGCTPVVLSRNFLLSSTTALEWSWVILASSAFIVAVQSRTSSRWPWLAAFGAGVVGSTARLDFGGLPAIWAICAWTSWWLARNATSTHRATTSTIGLVGSAIATVAALFHHWILFGNAIPGSARAKGLWANLVGSSFEYELLLDLIGTMVLPWSGLFTAALLGLAAWGSFGLLRGSQLQLRQEAWLGIAAGLTIVFYLALYSWSAGVQIWYTQNFAIPTLWLVASAIATSARRLKKRCGRVLLATGITLVSAYNVSASLRPEWPWQISMKIAGSEIAGRDDLGCVGSWNAGILGFFQGGTVVNLDGLVNDEVYPYIERGTLACYLQQRDVRYLADFDLMLSPDSANPAKGGYGDGILIAAAVPIDVLAQPVDRDKRGKWSGASLVLYELDWGRAHPLDCGTRDGL